MPNSNSAAKRHRESVKRHQRNSAVRRRVKTAVKGFNSALKDKNQQAAKIKFAEFVKIIDTAAGKGVLHRNNVARKKSRLHKKLAILET